MMDELNSIFHQNTKSKQVRRKNKRPSPCTLIAEIYRFDWSNKWLNGQEYEYILLNFDKYLNNYQFEKFPFKTHPISIYQEPENGLLYFVEGLSLGMQFGFPRIFLVKKKYKWKKMNFTTDLPKNNPLVSYIVANGVKCGSMLIDNCSEHSKFRMHAVILKDEDKRNKLNNGKGLILCHVRKLHENCTEVYKNGPEYVKNHSNSLKSDDSYNKNSSKNFDNLLINNDIQINSLIKNEGKEEEYKDYTRMLSFYLPHYRLETGEIDYAKIFSNFSK